MHSYEQTISEAQLLWMLCNEVGSFNVIGINFATQALMSIHMHDHNIAKPLREGLCSGPHIPLIVGGTLLEDTEDC